MEGYDESQYSLLIDGFAAIAPRISGGLSTISSSLIIIMIFRSQRKLSTIYHRLMFAMSSAGILGSMAMGLTTLPMPRDSSTSDDREGKMLGTIQTCEAQGFFVMFGNVTMFIYTGTLCMYYTCAIAFKMSEERIAKRVEPLLHIIPLAAGLAASVPPLLLRSYNASPLQAWCSISAGDDFDTGLRTLMSVCFIAVVFIATKITCDVILFALIIWRVHRTERLLSSQFHTTNNRRTTISQHSGLSSYQSQQVQNCHENTKVVIAQACAYMLSFFITLVFPFLRALLKTNGSRFFARLLIVFMPLQGFFNAVIFISHKIHNYRRVNQEVSRCEVLRLLVKGALNEPVLLSRISQIESHGNNGTAIRVELVNEIRAEQVIINRNYDSSSPNNDGANLLVGGGEFISNKTKNLSGSSKSRRSQEVMPSNSSNPMDPIVPTRRDSIYSVQLAGSSQRSFSNRENSNNFTASAADEV